jgi:hypothetical protein
VLGFGLHALHIDLLAVSQDTVSTQRVDYVQARRMRGEQIDVRGNSVRVLLHLQLHFAERAAGRAAGLCCFFAFFLFFPYYAATTGTAYSTALYTRIVLVPP